MNDQTDELAAPRIQKPSKAPEAHPVRILLILIIIAAVIEAAAIISRYISPESYYGYTYDDDYNYDDYFSGADTWERGGIEYLSDEEVKNGGVACTELAHFDFSGESLIEKLYDIFEDAGLGVASEDITSFNRRYGDGGSCYETLLTFYLDVPGDDSPYQRLTLDYDTATQALHEIDLFISDEECVLNLADAVISMLCEPAAAPDTASFEEAEISLAHSIERGENMNAVYGSEESGYTAVTLYCFEDGYSIYIGREQIYGELE